MITFETIIKQLAERDRIIIATKREDGTINEVREPLGWFITTQENISFGVGTEKPAGLSVGDRLRITMEKIL